MVKYNIQLNWKEHFIDLEAFTVWAKAQDVNCCGSSADENNLIIHFLEEPSQEIKDTITQKWEDMDDDTHEMCASYESQADRNVAKAVAKQSAIAALVTASGLIQEQIEAIFS